MAARSPIAQTSASTCGRFRKQKPGQFQESTLKVLKRRNRFFRLMVHRCYSATSLQDRQKESSRKLPSAAACRWCCTAAALLRDWVGKGMTSYLATLRGLRGKSNESHPTVANQRFLPR